MSYNSYLNTAHKRAVRIALNKIESAFSSCMSFNKNKLSACDTFEKIGYKKSDNQRANFSANTNTENICFMVRKKEGPFYQQEGLRACVQFQNGSIFRRCFESKRSDHNRFAKCGRDTSNQQGGTDRSGICCPDCSHTTNCEVGTGGKPPDPTPTG